MTLGYSYQELYLEYAVKEKKAQLAGVKNEIVQEQTERESLNTYLNQLTLEKTRLEAQLAQYRKQLDQDINNLSNASKTSIREINDSLNSTIGASLSEINKLAEEATRVGKEVGKMEASIESLSWVKPLVSMVRGNNGLDDYQVRVIGLTVLRSMSLWLNENHGQGINLYFLKNNIQSAIKGLEEWKS